VDNGSRLYKVQVKTSVFQDKNNQGSWKFMVAHGSKIKKHYTKNDVDFVACHIVPLDLWYILPIEAMDILRLGLRPESKDSKWNIFKEAWHLLGGVIEKAKD
jgi:hypothetical protein